MAKKSLFHIIELKHVARLKLSLCDVRALACEHARVCWGLGSLSM